MAKHHDLTGALAVHPFAFVQASDPALDPDNDVTAYKAWIDTSAGNALKMRNATNDGWETVQAGSAQASAGFTQISYIQTDVFELPYADLANSAWHQITYV